MKHILKFAMTAAALTIGSNAFGAYTGPVVTKTSGGGFTPPAWQNFESCELYSNKVVITHSYGSGSLVNVETRRLTQRGTKTLLAVAQLAASEEVTSTDNSMCDAPSTSINTVKILPNDTVERLTLFTTGGCGSPRLEREGPYSHMLKDLVGQYCGTTLDSVD